MKKKNIIIVGAGPAGLMAAITAGRKGHHVQVFEAMPKPARKLGISGKGRGNLTNTCNYKEFLKHFNNDGRFLKTAFKKFFNKELVEFFKELGVETTEERGGRVFVASGKALDAVIALHNAALALGIVLRQNYAVTSLIIASGACVGVQCGPQAHYADAVILATGGKSYPRTGSTGDGYAFAEQAGHRITPLHPSLIALKCDKDLATLKTVALRNIRAELRLDGKKAAEEFGEMNFLDGELAGPVVITLSRRAVPALAAGQACAIFVDLKPALNHEQLDARILKDMEAKKQENALSLMRGFLPRELCGYFLRELGMSGRESVQSIKKETRTKIRNLLKELVFKVVGHAGWDKAIVTAGGVDTSEVSPLNMESKLVKNLYICGELLDIDADTGGFNLQAAFSTGRLAIENG